MARRSSKAASSRLGARRGGSSTTTAPGGPDPLAALPPFRACAEAPGAKLGQGAFGVVYAPQFLECARRTRPDLVRACAATDGAETSSHVTPRSDRRSVSADECAPLTDACARGTVTKAFIASSEFGYEIKAVRRVLRMFKGRLNLTALRPDVATCGVLLRLGGPPTKGRVAATADEPARRALMYRRFDGDMYTLLRREDLPTPQFLDALMAGTRAFLRFCAVIHPSTLHVDSKLENLLYLRAPSGGGYEVVVSDYGMLAPTRDVGEDGTPPLMSPLLSLKVHDRHGTGGLERQRRGLWALADPFLTVYSAYTTLRDTVVRRDLSRVPVPGVVDFHAMGASMLWVADRMRPSIVDVAVKRALLLEAAKLLLLSVAPGTAEDADAAQRLRDLDALEPTLRARVRALGRSDAAATAATAATADAAAGSTTTKRAWWQGTASTKSASSSSSGRRRRSHS